MVLPKINAHCMVTWCTEYILLMDDIDVYHWTKAIFAYIFFWGGGIWLKFQISFWSINMSEWVFNRLMKLLEKLEIKIHSQHTRMRFPIPPMEMLRIYSTSKFVFSILLFIARNWTCVLLNILQGTEGSELHVRPYYGVVENCSTNNTQNGRMACSILSVLQ